MICANCGTENRAGRKFCLQCGSGLASACPNCGAENEPQARFCGNCGHGLGGTEAAAVVPVSASAAPTPTERRFVSVVFADLVGFTPFAEERDAEDVRSTLERYGAIAQEVVARYGGTVEKFIGDAVMAVWGTPTAHEDDAERAVRAALDLTDAVRTLAPGIEARAGVLTGEAAVNLGATDQSMLAGDLVNTAARLQAAAPPGTVLVGESTMRATSAAVAYEPAGDQTLKGKSTPVPAWLALRVVAQRRGAGRTETLETPFVGRDEEFRSLREQLHLTGRDPRVRLVSVTGPAGIGKSRLAWELEKYLDGIVETVYWHRGRSPAYGEGVTFWALGEMVRTRARLPENADEQTTRAGIREAVGQYVADESEREWIESALLALLGVADSTASGRELLFAAWRRFFENVASAGTTVLVFEDVQWADPGLLDFIDHLLDWSKSAPLLVITLARPELFDSRPDWGAGRRTFTALALDPLPERDMRAMLAGLVPDLPESAVRAIVGRADGIPLYAVETVRMLLADGRLARVDGAHRPTTELGALEVPETLRSLIAARLDGLDPADRRLLQEASVLGQSFSIDALAAITGGPPLPLAERLRGLVRRELLSVEADPRSPERGQYGFVQSLIREVAYSTLSRSERREKHLAAARQLEAGGADELAAALAGHYLAAHHASAPGPEADAVAAQARIALRAAADRAASLAGHKQAATFLQQAIGLTVDPSDRATLLERLAVELQTAGRYADAEAAARAAIDLVRDSDPAAEARLRGSLGGVLIDQGKVEEAIKDLEAALAELPAGIDAAVRADVLAKLARAYYRNVEWQKALETAEQALVLAERQRLLVTLGEAIVTKATALDMAARPVEALALFKAGLQIAIREGDIQSEFRARANMGGLLSFEEGAIEAIHNAFDALATARARGDLSMTVWHVGNVLIGCVFGSDRPLDVALAQADELLTMDLSESDRQHILSGYIGCGAMYGLDVSAMETELATPVDPQVRRGGDFYRVFPHLARGEWITASETAEQAGLASPRLDMLHLAAQAALVGDDPARARRLIELAREMPVRGRLGGAMARASESLLLALDGRSGEALTGLRESLRLADEMSAQLLYGTLALSILKVLGPNSPDARAAGEHALATFEQQKNRAMAGHLRAALGQRPSATAAAMTEASERAEVRA